VNKSKILLVNKNVNFNYLL